MRIRSKAIPAVVWSAALRRQLDDALLALGRLDAITAHLPMRRCSSTSSCARKPYFHRKIEGTQSSLADLPALCPVVVPRQRRYAKAQSHVWTAMERERASGGTSKQNELLALRERLRETEASLHAVRERYEAAMGALNESFFEWDIARDRIFYSENMRRVLGLPEEMLASANHWADRIHPEDRSHYESALIAHLTRATDHFKCEYRFKGFDGKWRWAQHHGGFPNEAIYTTAD